MKLNKKMERDNIEISDYKLNDNIYSKYLYNHYVMYNYDDNEQFDNDIHHENKYYLSKENDIII